MTSLEVARPGRVGRLREAVVGYLCLTPALVVFAAFFFYPLGRLVYLSLHEERGLLGNTRLTYVGFAQWRDVLGGDEFGNSLWVSLRYVLFTVPTGIALGLILAVIGHRRLRGIKAFQTIFSSTVASSVAVASVTFFALVNPEVGYFREISWLDWLNTSNPDTALLAVSVSSIWQNLGLTFVIVLAALQAIPEDVVEAASLDGFGALRRFFRITLPLISPALMFLAVVLAIFAMQAFGQIDILTSGGPAGETETLVFSIVNAQFTRPDDAAVMALGLFGVTLLITLAQFALLERHTHYGGRS